MQNNYFSIKQRAVAVPPGASTELVPNGTGRGYLALQNNGGTDLTLGFGQAAVIGQGWVIAAGSSFTFTNSEGVPMGQITGISSGAVSVIVLEG